MLHTEEVSILLPQRLPEENKLPVIFTIGPSLTMILPMILMLILSPYIYGEGGNRYLLMMLVMSSSCVLGGLVWGLSSNRYRRKSRELKLKDIEDTFDRYLISKDEHLGFCMEENRAYLLKRFESSKDIIERKAADHPFSHSLEDTDALFLRLALGSMPFQMKIYIQDEPKEMFPSKDVIRARELIEKYKVISDIPVGVDLKKSNIVGISLDGKKEQTYEVILSMIFQMVYHIAPSDLKICLFFDEDNAYQRRIADALRFLPHIFVDGNQKRLLAGNTADTQSLLPLLNRMLENENRGFYMIFWVLNDRHIYEETFWQCLKRAGEYKDISAVFLCDKQRMPNNLKDDISMERYPHIEGIKLNTGERECRALSGYIGERADKNSQIPVKVDFTELYDANSISRLHIEELWEKNMPDQRLRVPIGIGQGGKKIYLDLHEKFHGPHGLIAGTTGSGKSEFIETFLLSLCVSFSPDSVNFFMIDYKGGGTGRHLSKLPHCAGVISNLSGEMINRALKAIAYENKRRQELLAKYGLSHIDELIAKRRLGFIEESMPHLIFIIDEFAELRKEEPEFISEIISLAAVGRSLGIHLILATQKPAGVIDDKIFSNTNSKICLRVQDRQDSMDMLHRPEASYLTRPGQCYIQIGNNEYFELFQTGYCKGEYLEEENRALEFFELTQTGERKALAKATNPTGYVTLIEKLVEDISKLAKENEYKVAKALWLSPLPQRISADNEGLTASAESFVVGKYDDPLRQTMGVIKITPEETGNVLVVGNSGTGKTGFLLRILSERKKDDAFIIVDMKNDALKGAAHSDYTMGLLCDEEGEEIFFYHMRQLLKERNTKVANMNAANPGRIVMLIDDFGDFYKKLSDGHKSIMAEILGNGLSKNIYVMATASSAQNIPGTIFNHFKTVFAFEMNDKFQYGDALRQYHIDVFPKKNTQGRCIFKLGEEIVEGQIALPGNLKEKTNEGRYAMPMLKDRVEAKDLINDLQGARELLPIGYSMKTGYLRGLKMGEKQSFIISSTSEKASMSLFMTLLEILKDCFGIEENEILDFGKGGTLPSEMTDIRYFFISDVRGFLEACNKELSDYKLLVILHNPSKDADLLISPIMQECVRNNQGIHIGGNALIQRVMDLTSVSYSDLCAPGKDNIGFLKLAGRDKAIKVKIPSKEDDTYDDYD